MNATTVKSHSLTDIPIHQWLLKGVLISTQPGKVVIGWGDFRWHADVTAEDSATSFYFPDYFLQTDKPWLTPKHSAVVEILDLLLLLEKLPTESTIPIIWKEPSRELFEEGFNELQQQFQETPLEKVVLYAISKSENKFTESQRKQSLISVLRYTLETPVFAYGFWEGSEEGILGATPELLFRLHGEPSLTLETMALAGTQKTDTFSHEMLKNKKLLHEHQIVVGDIKEQLLPLGQVHAGALQVMELPVLSHLYTPISLKLEEPISFTQLVKKLHPTPALGGFPRKIAIKWLNEYSLILHRGRFGAPVGLWNPATKEYSCYVAIRNVMWNRNEITLGAGCGIVTQSTLQEEWDEVLLKTESIKRILQL